jgi:hypothetical protein
VPAGRIIDHVRNSQGFGLEDLAVLVLDEADRLLEMGFKEEVGLSVCVVIVCGGGWVLVSVETSTRSKL